jgi:hypothetical protein
MKQYYFACMPASSGAPNWTLTNCRIEKAGTGRGATLKAFGRGDIPDSSPYAKYDCGKWLVKNMGSLISVIHSDRKRMALLRDRTGWVDPYAYRLKPGEKSPYEEMGDR